MMPPSEPPTAPVVPDIAAPRAYLNRIGIANPPHDVHDAFVAFGRAMLDGRRDQVLFDRMARRAGIAHRRSVLEPAPPGGAAIDGAGWYRRGAFPSTAARMRAYETHALDLASAAVAGLGALGDITQLVVVSCTGMMAPGLDQLLARRLGLRPDLERAQLGFMGCSAAVPALRTARNAVAADPRARVLVVALELCTLHLQETADLETVLSFLLFGDGCAAALVSADPVGASLDGFRALAVPDSDDLITWRVGDQGFDMRLSGEVPNRIGAALRVDMAREDDRGILAGARAEQVAHWAVHPGGRSVLDAVEAGYGLPEGALADSRAVLRDHGNMSSATLLFVLRRMLERGAPGRGIGMAFGPGMAVETLRFNLLGNRG